MARCRFVESGGNDLPLYRTLHVGDFLGPFVDQQDDQIALWVVLFDAIGDVLQQHGLTGARRGDDQRTLTLTDGRHEVDDPRGAVFDSGVVDLHRQTLVGVEWRQVLKSNLVAGLLRRLEVDLGHFGQREIAFGVVRRFDQPFNGVPGAQRPFADHVGRDIDVIGARQIVRFGRAQETESVLQHFQHAVA